MECAMSEERERRERARERIEYCRDSERDQHLPQHRHLPRGGKDLLFRGELTLPGVLKGDFMLPLL